VSPPREKKKREEKERGVGDGKGVQALIAFFYFERVKGHLSMRGRRKRTSEERAVRLWGTYGRAHSPLVAKKEGSLFRH